MKKKENKKQKCKHRGEVKRSWLLCVYEVRRRGKKIKTKGKHRRGGENRNIWLCGEEIKK